MLFSDAVFTCNIFAGVFDILNDFRQNVAVVLLFLYSIIPNLDVIIRVCMLLCSDSHSLARRIFSDLTGSLLAG